MKASRVVLVTGAAGGLGQALVAEFASVGWLVGAGYHQTPPGIQREEIWPVALDVSKPDAVERGIRDVLTRWKRVDVLVNNAGITADHLLGQMSDDDWDHVLDVNLKGAFLCAQAVLPSMLRQQTGHIINIGSYSGHAGQRGQSNYSAAKAGLIGLSTSLARETGSRNVRVNTVLPGVLPTAMTARLHPQQVEALARANVLGRLNSIGEVARFIAFLAGTENVSGQIFQLDSRIGPWS